MHSYATGPVSLVLLLLGAFQAPVAAKPLLTVTCDAPQGVDMSYGSGLFGLREGHVETSSVGYPDVHPAFLIDEDTPQRLLVTFGVQPARPEPPAPAQPFEASIIYTTDDQITAVAPRGEAVWMYSLVPHIRHRLLYHPQPYPFRVHQPECLDVCALSLCAA